MAVRTVRFNKEEENKLKVLLAYYNTDFSNCVKELFAEKLEDLQDMGVIKKIKEGKKEDYLTAGEIDNLFAA
ncbi:MAG TPA: DUF6290 family protein [bacterium]|nr:DUF6290 family protein [bacterium]